MRVLTTVACVVMVSCTGSAGPLPSELEQHTHNTPPLVSIDAVPIVRLPKAVLRLHAAASDSEGDPLTWLWSQTSGPALTLANVDTADLTLSDLVTGTFEFAVRVTDSQSAETTATTRFSIKGPNELPVVNGGGDKNLTLPTNLVQLTGTATDLDGTISSTRWSKTFGGVATLANEDTLQLSLSGLEAGHYLFRLTATDDAGGSVHDEISLNVSAVANAAPTVTVNTPVSIQLPVDSIMLTAAASDSDGTIASHQWSKVSGGTAMLGVSSASMLSVTGLQAGTYVFRIRVADQLGATASADALVTVLPAP